MRSIAVFHVALTLYSLDIVNIQASDLHCPSLCYCVKKSRKALCNVSSMHYIPRFPKYIDSVTVTNTSIRAINNDGLVNLTFHQIHALNFTGNHIDQIHPEAFIEMKYLNRLVISQEPDLDIQSLKISFRGLTSRLKTLDLSYNLWKMLPVDMFATLNNSHMLYLHLRGNKFTFIHFNSFMILKRLQRLDLSENQIEQINISSLPELDRLDLSNNVLAKLPNWCDRNNSSCFPKLRLLILSTNNIGNIGSQSLTCLPRVERLYMDNLRVDRLCNNVFENLLSLKTLSLSKIGNPLKYIEPFAFNSSSLRKLSVIYTKFRFDSKRYDKNEIFAHCTNLMSLDLSGNYIPDYSLRQILLPLKILQILRLDSSNMLQLPRYTFTNRVSLKTLSLADNNIRGWNNTEEIFGNMTSLEYLSIRQNYISVINQTSFPQKLLSRLKTLNLARNPYSCTCNQLWFRNWIEKKNITLLEYPSQYRCRFPADMSRLLLQQYHPTYKLCNPWNPLYTLAIAMGSLVVLIVILSSMAVKCQANIKNYIYLLRVYKNKRRGYIQIDSEDDYEFHAFVVYCDDDRKWVHGELLDKLENEEGLTLCIHHRNFDVGDTITSNIDNYLKRSWKVIIVISNNFAKSEWCQWEVDVVQARRRRQGGDVVLPIMLQNVDSNHMTSQIRTLLDSTPYVTYRSGVGSDLFWKAVAESLRKPLGHPPVSLI